MSLKVNTRSKISLGSCLLIWLVTSCVNNFSLSPSGTSGGKEEYEYMPVEIGSNCYIGPNTVIAKGVSIGDGCIIGANSFVNKSFAKGAKIAGSPAKII